MSGLDLQEEKAEFYTRMREARRKSHICANCECSDSSAWYISREEEEDVGFRYCYRCEAHFKSYGHYPNEAELMRLEQKAFLVASYADNPPPPGYCENPECQNDGNSK